MFLWGLMGSVGRQVLEGGRETSEVCSVLPRLPSACQERLLVWFLWGWGGDSHFWGATGRIAGPEEGGDSLVAAQLSGACWAPCLGA